MSDTVQITANVIEGSPITSNLTDGVDIITNVVEGTTVVGTVVTGAKGDKGDTGATGPQGPQGPQGNPGVGIPTGGTANQILTKDSGTDYDTSWQDAPADAVDSVNGQTGVVVLDSDDIAEGSTNFYSQWQEAIYGGGDYLEPIAPMTGIVVGQDPHSSVTTTFGGASAIFNGDILTGDASNFFPVLSYGLGGFNFGSIVALGGAQGTAAAPSTVTNGNYLGGYVFAGSNATDFVLAGSGSSIGSGLWGQVTDTPVGAEIPIEVWIGGISTKMIAYDTFSNEITLNKAQQDANIIAYYSGGGAWSTDGGTGVTNFDLTPTVPDDAYGVGWDGSLETPTKNAVYDKIETLVIQDTSDVYTVSNVTTDRTYDANATTINELADVLGTLIADLQGRNVIG